LFVPGWQKAFSLTILELYQKNWSYNFDLTQGIRYCGASQIHRGHEVECVEQWSQTMGHAQAIWIDQEQGILHGGADPRGDGMAIGW
jgi:gamma-glutamyltranspeptidase